jgi:hypothetical protein
MNKRFGALQPILGSSKNPEDLSMTVKGILLALIPVVIGLGKSFGWEFLEADLTDIVNNSFLAVSAVVTVWGIIRKFKKTD